MGLDRDVSVETIRFQRREGTRPVKDAVNHPFALTGHRIEAPVLEVHMPNPRPRQGEAAGEHVVLAPDEGVAGIPVETEPRMIGAPAHVRGAARELRDLDVQPEARRRDFVGGVAQHLDHLV